jgi:hypothetical protein
MFISTYPMMMAPDHTVNVLTRHTYSTLVQYICHILLNIYLEQWIISCYPRSNNGGQIPIIFADTDIEQYMLVLCAVADEKREAWEFHDFMAGNRR